MRYFILLAVLLTCSAFAKTFTLYCTETDSAISCTSVPAPVATHDHVVSDAAELAETMAKILPGQSIGLNPGAYGDLTITKQWEPHIKLVSKTPKGATIGTVTLDGAARGGVRFDSVTANSFDMRSGASGLQVVKSLVRGNLYFKDASDILIQDTEVRTDLSDGLHSIRANSVKRFTLEHSLLTGAREDLLAVAADSEDVHIIKNLFYNTKPKQTIGPVEQLVGGVMRKCQYNHSDGLQFFGNDGLNPRRVLVEGNLFFDDPADNEVRVGCGDGRITMQGVFLADSDGQGYEDITVRNNVFYVGSPNTIYINSAVKNVLIENNTLIGWGNGGGGIRVIEKTGKSVAGLTLRNNLARSISNTSTTFALDPAANRVYLGTDAPKLFSFEGMATTWQSFLPRGKDFPDTMGATLEIRNGVPPGPRK